MVHEFSLPRCLRQADLQLYSDPACPSITGGNLALLPALARAMINATALICGEMYAVTDENGALVGYTLWVPPGRVLFDSEDQRRLGFTEVMKEMSEEGKEYYERVLGVEFPEFLDESIGITQAEMNCYWCNFAMIKEDYQNKGLATAMFALVEEKAKKTGAIMALSTSEDFTSKIYQGMGFELQGYKMMPSPWKDWPSYVLSKDTKAT